MVRTRLIFPGNLPGLVSFRAWPILGGSREFSVNTALIACGNEGGIPDDYQWLFFVSIISGPFITCSIPLVGIRKEPYILNVPHFNPAGWQSIPYLLWETKGPIVFSRFNLWYLKSKKYGNSNYRYNFLCWQQVNLEFISEIRKFKFFKISNV